MPRRENCHSTRDRGASILRRFVPCSSRAFPASCHYSWRNPLPGDAPEADMACRGVDRLGMTRGRPIAATVIGSAKMRTAFKHLAWNPDVRMTRVVAGGLGPAARIFRNAARLWRIGFMLRRIPIVSPFPDIADHVVQPVAVGRECSDRRGTFEAVGAEVSVREFALPSVGHVPAAWRELRAPGVFGVG